MKYNQLNWWLEFTVWCQPRHRGVMIIIVSCFLRYIYNTSQKVVIIHSTFFRAALKKLSEDPDVTLRCKCSTKCGPPEHVEQQIGTQSPDSSSQTRNPQKAPVKHAIPRWRQLYSQSPDGTSQTRNPQMAPAKLAIPFPIWRQRNVSSFSGQQRMSLTSWWP